MIPLPSVFTGVAIITVIWLTLWRIADRSRPVTWRWWASGAVAFAVIALDRQSLLAAAIALVWMWHASAARFESLFAAPTPEETTHV